MTVREAIEHLRLMPQDSRLVAWTDPVQAEAPPGAIRPGQTSDPSLLGGFSARELRTEDYDLLNFESEGLVVLALTVRSDGRAVS